MAKTLKVVVIGYGFMGKMHSSAHANVNHYFTDLPYRVERAELCGLDDDQARAFADDSVETDWRQVMARDDVDVVDICVPKNLHQEIAIAAARAGSGVTGDLLAHAIDTAMWLNGPIIKGMAEIETFVKERLHQATGKVEPAGIDDASMFMCRFANGSMGLFESTCYARGHKALTTQEMNGEDGSVRFNLDDRLHDFEGEQTYTEKPGHLFELNKTFAEVDPADYDAFYVAGGRGGRGPKYISIYPREQAIVREFHDAKKPIFTICHGVQVLIAVEGVVSSKRVAAVQYCEPEVRLPGGICVDVPPVGAISDGNLVSANGWPGLAAFMRQCPKVQGTEIRHG